MVYKSSLVTIKVLVYDNYMSVYFNQWRNTMIDYLNMFIDRKEILINYGSRWKKTSKEELYIVRKLFKENK